MSCLIKQKTCPASYYVVLPLTGLHWLEKWDRNVHNLCGIRLVMFKQFEAAPLATNWMAFKWGMRFERWRNCIRYSMQFIYFHLVDWYASEIRAVAHWTQLKSVSHRLVCKSFASNAASTMTAPTKAYRRITSSLLVHIHLLPLPVCGKFALLAISTRTMDLKGSRWRYPPRSDCQ